MGNARADRSRQTRPASGIDDRPNFGARIAAVKERLSPAELIGRVVTLRGAANNLVGLCPFHNEKTPSFRVFPDHYHCFGCGAHGDVLQFQIDHRHQAVLEALTELEGIAGTLAATPRPKRPQSRAPQPQTVPAQAAKSERPDEYHALLRIWRDSERADGTAVEGYLKGRIPGFEVLGGVPVSLRYHPSLLHVMETPNGEIIRSRWPAMVAGVQAADGALLALHRTYLRVMPDGGVVKAANENWPDEFKAKKIKGPFTTGAIRLTPRGRDGYGEDRLMISEGIETGLSMLVDLVRNGRRVALWAAGTLGNICGGGDPTKRSRRHPDKPGKFIQTEFPDIARPGVILPDAVKEVFILADGDSDRLMTEAMMKRATRRWQMQGRIVRVVWAPKGMDFNDLARGQAPAGGS